MEGRAPPPLPSNPLKMGMMQVRSRAGGATSIHAFIDLYLYAPDDALLAFGYAY